MRLLSVILCTSLLAACAAGEDHDDPLPLGGKLDVPSTGGDFAFSFADLANAEGGLQIPGLRCPDGEICDFSFALVLDEGDLTPAELAIREYDLMAVEASYLDADRQTHRESAPVRARRLADGFGLFGGTFTVAGTDVGYSIRPDISIDLSGPSIDLEGIRFRGTIALCGGRPCSW
jgi:hypothetical protein